MISRPPASEIQYWLCPSGIEVTVSAIPALHSVAGKGESDWVLVRFGVSDSSACVSSSLAVEGD